MSVPSQTQQQTVTLTIDGKQISVPKGTTVYAAAKKLGIEIPIFCYHDRMPPFGACRMCLVEIEKMPKLATSCTQEAAEGMVVKTRSEQAVKGREGILEFLLVNHPLDCPICDRGGECPLQDQTLKHGPGESRFVEEKRHFEKRMPLGPVLMLDRERCIACARCTRFGELVAGDHALEFIDRGWKTEVGTPGGGPAESKFIGNTIMICPVGALTSQVYRFRARPWDNDAADSVCALCPIGCNLILDSRDGQIVRTRSRENRDVNDLWLCDKGWFGYEFSSHPERLKKPLVRRDGRLVETGWEEALDLAAAKIREARGSGKIAGLGGAALTLEENYLFQKLMREGAGSPHVDHRVGEPAFDLEEEGVAPGMEISLGKCEELKEIFVFGADLTEEFPVLWLRLKQAVNKGARIFYFGHFAPETAQHFFKTVVHPAGAEWAAAREHAPHIPSLAAGKKAAIFVGQQYLNTPHRRAILAELLKARAAGGASLNLIEGKENFMASRLAGVRPDLGAFGQKLTKTGLSAPEIFEKGAAEGWRILFVAGANPAAQIPSKIWKALRAKTGFIVVQDLFLTATAAEADVVLPALSFLEKGGRAVNIEGRIQELRPGKEIPEGVLSDGEIFMLLSQKLGNVLALEKGFNEKAKPGRVAPPRPEKLDAGPSPEPSPLRPGELALSLSPKLFDRGVRMSRNPQTAKLTKEPAVRVHPQEGAKLGLNPGQAVRLSTAEGLCRAKIVFDDKVAPGTAVVPTGFPEIAVQELGLRLRNGMGIQINVD